MASAETQFLQDLAVITGVAALTTILFQRIKFPLVFGLIAAGIIVGPHTPPFSLVRDLASLQVLANLGITLLLFGLGLDFDLRALRRFGFGALVVTTAEVFLMFGVGYQTGQWLGWGTLDSAFLGAMLSISSTAIIVAVLREMGKVDEESSRLVFAVLVLEDVAAILILVLLSGYVATGDLPIQDGLVVMAQMGLFLVAFLVLGLLVIPRFLQWVMDRFRTEVVVLTVMGLALGGAMLSDLVGFHVGLGAFLTGALCAEAKSKVLLEETFRPIHDLFAAVFFVAIGTLVDFRILAEHWLPVLWVTVAIIVGKTASGFAAAFLAGYSPRTSFAVGAALSQIGEFSFVIATLGLATGAMSPGLFPIIVGAAAITSLTSPFMIRSADVWAGRIERRVPIAVRTYASIYGTFLRTWRERPKTQMPKEVRRERRNAIASGTLLLLAWGGALVLQNWGVEFLAARGLPRPPLIYWAISLAILVPSFIETDKHLSRWIELSFKARPRSKEGLGVRAVVRATLYFGIVLLIGLPVLIATGPALHNLGGFAIWSALVTGVTFLLWRGIRRLHHRVSENIGHILEGGDVSIPVPDVLTTLVTRDFPLQLGVATIVLPQNGLWTERRLSETELRATTGSSVALLERADGRQVVPGPDTLLLAGDRLTVVGEPEQLAAARGILERVRVADAARIPLHPGRIAVQPGGPLDGRLLVDSALRSKHGLHVVAIQRGSEAIANPAPTERIVGGDVLIVLGTREQIFSAVEDSRVRPPPGSR